MFLVMAINRSMGMTVMTDDGDGDGGGGGGGSCTCTGTLLGTKWFGLTNL